MSYISHITCADFLPQELQNILRCLHSTPRSAVCVVADIVSGLPRVCQPAKGAAQASSSPGVLPKDHRPVQFGWFEGMHLKCSKWHSRACLDCCFLGLTSVSLSSLQLLDSRRLHVRHKQFGPHHTLVKLWLQTAIWSSVWHGTACAHVNDTLQPAWHGVLSLFFGGGGGGDSRCWTCSARGRC